MSSTKMWINKILKLSAVLLFVLAAGFIITNEAQGRVPIIKKIKRSAVCIPCY